MSTFGDALALVRMGAKQERELEHDLPADTGIVVENGQVVGTVAIDPSLSQEELAKQIRAGGERFLKEHLSAGLLPTARSRLTERWFSWKPKVPGLPGKPPVQLAARIRYAPHDEPAAVWVHVQIEAGGRTYAAQFPFQREQLRTMRQVADDFMVAEFRKSLAREMTPPASVAKPLVTG